MDGSGVRGDPCHGAPCQGAPLVPTTVSSYKLPEEELRRSNITFLPTTLREALDCFEHDHVLQHELGEEYAAYYNLSEENNCRPGQTEFYDNHNLNRY